MMAGLHNQEVKHEHAHMSQPIDRQKILKGALPLVKVDGGYQIKLDEDFKGQKLKVIVIYGLGKRYYLTRMISI